MTVAQFECTHVIPIAVVALQDWISYDVIFLTYLYSKNEVEVY